MVQVRAEGCFSGLIEFYVPPCPPAYTPMALPVPAQSEALGQIGVTLVRRSGDSSSSSYASSYASSYMSPLGRKQALEARFVFKLQQADAFCKFVSLTRGEFNQMMAELKAAFPQQLESHFVVDVKKFWYAVPGLWFI